MKLKTFGVIALVFVAASLLGACQNVTPQQAQAIVATYQALPAPQRTARNIRSERKIQMPKSG